MSKASELEAARLAAERLDARCKAITRTTRNAGLEGAEISEVLADVATQLLAEATYISEQRKSGWKSRSDAHTAAGRILEQWAKDLAAYLERDKPPMRPPLDTIKSPDKHAGLDPANGPISAQITSGLLAATDAAHSWTNDDTVVSTVTVDSDWPDGAITPDAATRVRLAVEAGKGVDDKLDAAFGPVTYPDSNSDGFWNDAVVHITAAPANYAWCDATTGLRGYVGTATCPECIVRWDAYRESETTPVVGTLPGLGAVAWLGDGESVAFGDVRTDGLVRVEWNSKGETTVGIPQFSEPGPAPARQTQQRMTFEAVRAHGMARARGADHRSYSQVQAFSECGIRYALSDLDVTPAWWNVGGTALHYACETINHEAYQVQQTFGDGPQHVRTDHAIETLWTNCLNRSVSETIVEHPTAGPDTWRSAKKGAEGYDWWRTNGVDMVRRWITRLTWLYDQGWTIATVDGKPAIEFDCPMFIMLEPNAPGDRTGPAIKVENIIDLAMVRGDTFLIIDFKSGASDPTSTYQLGQYGHALNRALSAVGQAFAANTRIFGAYWLARTDMLAPVDVTKTDTATDIRELHPWSEIEYLITTMHAAESQGLYLPNKSKSDRFGCGSCGVAGFCPVGPR